LREFFLQGESEVRTDEAGPSSDNEVLNRVQFGKLELGRDR
jgi:hypothetical protein